MKQLSLLSVLSVDIRSSSASWCSFWIMGMLLLQFIAPTSSLVMSPWERLLNKHICIAMEKQLHFLDHQRNKGNPDWQFNMYKDSKLQLGDERYEVRIVGSDSLQLVTFLWGWCGDPTIPRKLPVCLKDHAEVRDCLDIFGSTQQLPTSEILNGHSIALVVSSILNAKAVFPGPYENGIFYLLITDKKYPKNFPSFETQIASKPKLERLCTGFRRMALQSKVPFITNQCLAFVSFADAIGGLRTEYGDRVDDHNHDPHSKYSVTVRDMMSGKSVLATFDQYDRLTSLDGQVITPTSSPLKQSQQPHQQSSRSRPSSAFGHSSHYGTGSNNNGVRDQFTSPLKGVPDDVTTPPSPGGGVGEDGGFPPPHHHQQGGAFPDNQLFGDYQHQQPGGMGSQAVPHPGTSHPPFVGHHQTPVVYVAREFTDMGLVGNNHLDNFVSLAESAGLQVMSPDGGRTIEARDDSLGESVVAHFDVQSGQCESLNVNAGAAEENHPHSHYLLPPLPPSNPSFLTNPPATTQHQHDPSSTTLCMAVVNEFSALMMQGKNSRRDFVAVAESRGLVVTYQVGGQSIEALDQATGEAIVATFDDMDRCSSLDTIHKGMNSVSHSNYPHTTAPKHQGEVYPHVEVGNGLNKSSRLFSAMSAALRDPTVRNQRKALLKLSDQLHMDYVERQGGKVVEAIDREMGNLLRVTFDRNDYIEFMDVDDV